MCKLTISPCMNILPKEFTSGIESFMKKILAILLVMFSSFAFLKSYAEVMKFTAISYSSREVDSRGSWGEWSDWKPCNHLVVFSDQNRITIYTDPPLEYDIVSGEDAESDGEGGSFFQYKCVDNDGNRSTLRWRFLKDNRQQLYIVFANAELAFYLEPRH